MKKVGKPNSPRGKRKAPLSSVDQGQPLTIVPVGLRNLKNNCYQNVIVQCLLRDPAVAEYLSSRSFSGFEVLSKQLSVVSRILSCPGPSSCLTELNVATRSYSDDFSPLVQEDAFDYLDFLLARLRIEMSHENVMDVFEYLFALREENENVCLSCGVGEISGMSEGTALSLPLPPDRGLTIGKCLDLYCNSPLDKYKCQHCGTLNFAARKLLISSLPMCLIIHLKRFKYLGGRICKDDRLVSCPIRLNLQHYTAEGKSLGHRGIYQLKGFICHIGISPHSGHYVSFYQIDKTHVTWYKFDDSTVTEVPVADLDCSKAYMLFYSADVPKTSAGELQELIGTRKNVNVPAELEITADQAPFEVNEEPKRVKRHLEITGISGDIKKSKRKEQCVQISDVPEDQEWDIDDNPVNVVLFEWDDVPGAILDTNDLDQYLVCELSRWLYCRNIQRSKTKDAIISQIQKHVANGESHILWSGVDDGYWLELKREKIRHDVGEEVVEEPILPVSGWRPFPSHDVPRGFNRGQVYQYLVGTHPGISKVVGKRLYVSLTTEDSRPGSEKILRRAENLEFSDFVHCPSDCKQGDRFYFVKAYVRASMAPIRYFVYVVLSAVSGTVLSAHCGECTASALNRCSHIGSLLKYMQKHVEERGYEAVTCTGRARTWGLGTVKKDPGRTIRPEYKKKTDELRRFTFDPRPTSHAQDTLSQAELHDFVYELQRAAMVTGVSQAFQDILPIRYEDFSLTDEHQDVVLEMCLQFYKNLRKTARSDPFLIPGTESQAGSEKWRQFRCIIFTASIAQRVLGLKSNIAKSNFLLEHLWRTKLFSGNKATKYGQKNENIARKQYVLRQCESDPTISVRETGLWIKQDYPMLGCSPDGIARSQTGQTKLVEIKCPAVVAKCDPANFDNHLSKNQLRNFSLEKRNGRIHLKKTHDHYFQVQMQMDVMRIYLCDYVVWSQRGMVVVQVSYDDEFWAPKRSELVNRHMSMLVPEYFLQRIPRNLSVIEIEA